MSTATPIRTGVRVEAEAWYREHWDPDMPLGDWWQRLAESGWGFPSWPEKWFGRGLTSDQVKLVQSVRAEVGATGPPSGIGVMMAGPSIVDHGTDEQCERFLPNMVNGKEIWCQLFSEPGAGSDLAGLQTRAVRDRDEWIVNGQKVWTSGAQYSRWGILIARTDVDVPKHEGITYFVIDMDQPGIEVRPLKEMTGGSTFNEVFLSDARVPHENVIGDVNRGWAVTVTTLAHERNSLGASGMSAMAGGAMIGRNDLSRPAGKPSGGGSEMAGMAAAFGGGGDLIKGLPAIAGGSDQIQRNIIGERVLGLPREPRVDKDLPFAELKVGTQR